jgi:hypothetical protein
MNLFKNKKKLTKIIVIVVLGAVALFCSTNEKASSVLAQIIKPSDTVSGTESSPAKNQKASSTGTQTGESSSSTSSSSPTGYSTTNRTSPTDYAPSTGYSTTNSDQLWSEIRNGYDDGDKAADEEAKRTRWRDSN